MVYGYKVNRIQYTVYKDKDPTNHSFLSGASGPDCKILVFMWPSGALYLDRPGAAMLSSGLCYLRGPADDITSGS